MPLGNKELVVRPHRQREEGGADRRGNLELGRALVVGHAIRRHTGLEVVQSSWFQPVGRSP